MATFHVKKSSAFHFSCEFQGFPITFINGLRRILVGEYLPMVVLRDINILVNTTQMPHEMIKHRMELLPIIIDTDNAEVIKNALVELKCFPIPDKDRILTTDDFNVEKGLFFSIVDNWLRTICPGAGNVPDFKKTFLPQGYRACLLPASTITG